MELQKNVLLCGIVKNVSQQLDLNICMAMKTCERFNKSKIIIYENNSKDNTKEKLKTYCEHSYFSSKLKVISEDIDDTNKNNFVSWAYTEITGSNHPCRMELISNARNKVIDEINKPEYDEYNYVLWIDFDSRGWVIDGIIDSLEKKEEWDVLLGNSPYYYDFYALRKNDFLFGPEIIGEPFWKGFPSYNFLSNPDTLIPVYSAFNGIGIYKKNIFKTFKYDFVVTEEVKQFYRKIINDNIETLNKNNKLIELIKNKCSVYPNGYEDELSEIFWKANSGYNIPILCEHVPLHFALYNHGYKLFINPKMIYYR